MSGTPPSDHGGVQRDPVREHLIQQRDNWREQAEVTQQALADVKEIWTAWDTSRKGGAAFRSIDALERIGDVIGAR